MTHYQLDILEFLFKSDGLYVNCNDFFNYASADSLIIDPHDLHWIVPICKKYPKSGLDAAVSFIAKQTPIAPYITIEYTLAYDEIVKLNPEIYSS